MTDGKEKFAWNSEADRTYFFDLVADPQEVHDLSTDPAHRERVALWRQRLIDILAARPQDGLSDGRRLIPGRTPAVRPDLLEKRRDCNGIVRPV